MKDYKARFTITLKDVVSTSELSFPKLITTPHDSGYIKSVELTPVIDESKRLHKFDAIVIYSGDDISRICEGWGENQNPRDGVLVIIQNGYLLPPWEITEKLIMPLLNCISALTLQAHIYSDIRKNIKEYISNFTWILPDGSEAPPSPHVDYPKFMLAQPPDLWGRPLNTSDWKLIQDICNGGNQKIPLWRVILANAHREQRNDIRNTIIQCATALDVGITPLLHGLVDKFDMRIFNGHYKTIGTPDLRTIDSPLYETLCRLWYTRHAIVHKGDSSIYDRNPIKGAAPLRPIQVFQDIPEFLRAVPKGIAYIENYPP